MNLNDAMARLYEAAIDCGVESYRGAGVIGWVVDARNRRIERHFAIDELDALGEWLCNEAVRQRNDDGSGTRSLLHELVGSRRKDPKRVTHSERDERKRDISEVDGTNH